MESERELRNFWKTDLGVGKFSAELTTNSLMVTDTAEVKVGVNNEKSKLASEIVRMQLIRTMRVKGRNLFEKEEISGFKFNSKTKQDLWDYMTKVVDKKTGATAYQKDSIDKGPEARYIFAYLMKNNWDASKLEKNLKNKVVSEVKKKLSNYSDGRSKIKSGTTREEKEQTNSFAGFRKLAV